MVPTTGIEILKCRFLIKLLIFFFLKKRTPASPQNSEKSLLLIMRNFNHLKLFTLIFFVPSSISQIIFLDLCVCSITQRKFYFYLFLFPPKQECDPK